MTGDRSDNPAATGGISDHDNADAHVKTYECDNCGNRIEAEHRPGTCPSCGGTMIDLEVSRE